MKILITVLTTQQEPYVSLTKAVKNTWASIQVPGIDIVFYHGQPLKENTEKDYYFDIQDHHDTIGLKTNMVFEYFLKRDFDYIFRVSTATYVNQPGLVNWLQDKPKTLFYAGNAGLCNDIEFMSGTGYIVSRDVVEKVVQNQNIYNSSLIDDVAMGKLMKDLNIPFYKKFQYASIEYLPGKGEYNIWKNSDSVVSVWNNVPEITSNMIADCFLFRCTNAPDRNNDIKIINKLHSLLTP